MNFHQPNKGRGTHVLQLLIGVGSTVGVLFVLNYFLAGQLSGFAQYSVQTLATAVQSVDGVPRTIQHALTQKEQLVLERDELQARVYELEIFALRNMALREENSALRALLGDTLGEAERVVVSILSRGGVTPYGTLTTSRPSRTPQIEARVYGTAHVVVGTVSHVFDTHLQVTLLSQPQRKTESFILSGETPTPATLIGRGNGNFVTHVSRDAEIALGDTVVLANSVTTVIGYVGDIAVAPTDAQMTVRVRTPVNLETVHAVSVETL